VSWWTFLLLLRKRVDSLSQSTVICFTCETRAPLCLETTPQRSSCTKADVVEKNYIKGLETGCCSNHHVDKLIFSHPRPHYTHTPPSSIPTRWHDDDQVIGIDDFAGLLGNVLIQLGLSSPWHAHVERTSSGSH